MTQGIARITLAGSGAILAVTGSVIMIAPRIFLATSEVIVGHDAGLMSEVTAPSGMLVIIGAFMVLSAIKLRFAKLGLVLGAMVYGSYGASRLVSTHLHGTPSETLIAVTYFELGVAALLFALYLTARQAKSTEDRRHSYS